MSGAGLEVPVGDQRARNLIDDHAVRDGDVDARREPLHNVDRDGGGIGLVSSPRPTSSVTVPRHLSVCVVRSASRCAVSTARQRLSGATERHPAAFRILRPLGEDAAVDVTSIPAARRQPVATRETAPPDAGSVKASVPAALLSGTTMSSDEHRAPGLRQQHVRRRRVDDRVPRGRPSGGADQQSRRDVYPHPAFLEHVDRQSRLARRNRHSRAGRTPRASASPRPAADAGGRSGGKRFSRNARYSPTGITTHPSVRGGCALRAANRTRDHKSSGEQAANRRGTCSLSISHEFAASRPKGRAGRMQCPHPPATDGFRT